MKKSVKKLMYQSNDYLMMFLGLFVMSFGYAAFILPEKVVSGGVAGVSTIIYFASHESINVAIPNFAINILLLVIAFRSVGRQFVIRTIIGATAFSLMLGILTPMFSGPLVQQQPFMNVIIGGVLAGVGLGTCFAHNGSSGGTDVIAAMASKHSTMSFGRIMLYVDLLIISSSYFLFHEVEKMVFGYVVLIFEAFVSDMVINNRYQGRQFLIFSKKWEAIATAITKGMRRGCTVIEGTGWYTKGHTKLLLVVCRKYESLRVQRVIKAIDPEAFVSMSSASNVYGEGFDPMKVRLSKKDLSAITKDASASTEQESENA